MRPAAEAEKLGIPSVVVTTTGFTAIAKAAGKAQGVTGLRVAEYPGAVGVHPEALVEKNVENVLFNRIVSELTQPRAGEAQDTSATSRRGNAIVYEGTFDEINDYFKAQLWSDELPIIPPTLERVEAFLKHTKRAPDEQIALLPQANLAATPWNIAANAVMAGCKPEHMPVLIAAVEAIADNAYNLNNIGSTWGVLPFLLINGPAAKKLGIENGAQLVNKGANPALGRALGLIIKNIAGYKLSRNYMGTFGYPLNFVVAENEAECPWDPYHVEHGFDKHDNTVTACGTVTWGWAPAIYGTEEKSAAQAALEFLAIEVTKKPCLARLVERGAHGFQNMITFLIAPPVAKALAAAGFTKQKIREYVYEHARVTYRELEFLIEYGHSEAFKIPDMVERGLLPKEYLVQPDELVRVLPNADVISIVVCGDPDRNRLMVLWGGYVKPVSKKIDLLNI
ncbi:MAG TPA: hypothetical protein VK642_03055 [Burkholderiales bacterium]|nr:hypothetical protein [Burkholderiales bacterium]